MDLKSKTCLFIDNGLFVHWAVRLAEQFGEVWYHSPYVGAFPKSNAVLIGDGLEGIQRIIDFDDYEDKADIVVFPDVGYGPLQERMVRDGRRVWGSRRGEDLELDRWKTKEYFKSLGMPVAETHLVIGMDQLRRFLQEMDGHWWIKTSRYRGDFETFESEDYDDVKPRLDQIESELGRKADIYPFIVEKNIEAIIEIGFDGFVIDGQFPEVAFFGREEKDLGLVGRCMNYEDFPEPVRWVNSKLAPYFKEQQYRGLFSSEIRNTEECVTDSEPEHFEDCPVIWNEGEMVPGTSLYGYFTDPCTRMASPPGELYCEWCDNWGEIVYAGADGELVTPHSIAEYGVEIMLHSAFADGHWQPVRFPESIRRWIKLRNHCRIKDVDYAVPQSVGLPEIGAAIGISDSLLEASKLALEHAYAVKGYFLEAKTDALSKTIAELNNAQEQGISFSDDPLPTAQEIEDLQLAEVE